MLASQRVSQAKLREDLGGVKLGIKHMEGKYGGQIGGKYGRKIGEVDRKYGGKYGGLGFEIMGQDKKQKNIVSMKLFILC